MIYDNKANKQTETCVLGTQMGKHRGVEEKEGIGENLWEVEREGGERKEGGRGGKLRRLRGGSVMIWKVFAQLPLPRPPPPTLLASCEI
jgi:hypothetical protein